MTSPVTEQRGNLMLGLVLGALAGIIAIVLAWFALVPRTAVTATTTPSPTAASTELAPADPASTPSADATLPMAALTRKDPVPELSISEPIRHTASDTSARCSSLPATAISQPPGS